MSERQSVDRLGRARWSSALAAIMALISGCSAHPSPLWPGLRGSVGYPHHGVLTDGVKLPTKGDGYVRYRTDKVRYGNPRLVAAIEHAASYVQQKHPESPPLVVADLSNPDGGKATRHRSHRTGRDVDLLFYVTTPDGRPVVSPGFVRFGPDGLAQTEGDGDERYVFFDVERNWLLVKALIEAPDAHVQWLFCARWLEAMLIEHAMAKGEPSALVWRAETVLRQPSDSASHSDHFHVRLACTPEEAVAGCTGGPRWPWLPPLPDLTSPTDDELVAAIVGDLLSGGKQP